jgi:hypothetical protein
MGAKNRKNSKQHKYADSCRIVGKMALLTQCGGCDRPVVGVVLQNSANYSMECKACGFSAVSHFSDLPF